METIWIVLGIVVLLLLFVYWRKRNAVWGGCTIGIIVGLIIFIFSGFSWSFIIKSAIMGTIIGFSAELLGRVSKKISSKKYQNGKTSEIN